MIPMPPAERIEYIRATFRAEYPWLVFILGHWTKDPVPEEEEGRIFPVASREGIWSGYRQLPHPNRADGWVGWRWSKPLPQQDPGTGYIPHWTASPTPLEATTRRIQVWLTEAIRVENACKRLASKARRLQRKLEQK